MVKRCVAIAVTHQQLVNSRLDSRRQSEPIVIRIVFKAQPTAQRANGFPAAGVFTEYQGHWMFETYEGEYRFRRRGVVELHVVKPRAIGPLGIIEITLVVVIDGRDLGS